MVNNSNPLVLRDFSIEELLRREPITLDINNISDFIKSKVILITGAAGSIGNELVRQVSKFNPTTVVLFDHNENNLFFLEKELNKTFNNVNFIVRTGSVCDKDRVRTIFEETMPNIVYHAAANKHVPLCEENPSEAINNNILGTHIIADASEYINADAFILISTDKAVKPTSVMGATKRIAETYIQLKAQSSNKTRFLIVRFGNVLGSAGSVVPIFKSQIEKGGPITVTHPDMYRFFMTIPEASQLLIQASAFGKGGEIFILDMGEPVKILDLARDMITLSGLKPDIDIKINFSGVRPGEKIYEELLLDSENIFTTNHEKIKILLKNPIDDSFFQKIIDLENLDANLEPKEIRKQLNLLIPDATLNC